jgi:ligand-binding sensor domain-containing protein/two-component sensor histidine kinase
MNARIIFKSICLFLFCFVFFGSLSSAQYNNIQFQHLTVRDGLSSNYIIDITEDSLGYMWFATQAGLNRYDGYKVESFRHEAYNEKSLPSDNVRNIYCDMQRTFWVGTDAGLARFNYLNHTFDTFKHNPADSNSLPANHVSSFVEDQYHNLWIGTANGLSRYDPAKHQFKTFTSDVNSSSISHNSIYEMEPDKNGNLWITTGKGLTFLNTTTLQFTNYFHDPKNPSSLSTNRMRYLAVDHEGKIWLGTYSSIVDRFDPLTETCIHYNISPNRGPVISNRIDGIFTDRSGTVWIAGDASGLFYRIPSSDSLYSLCHNPLISTSLSSTHARCIYQDKTGMIWIGTGTGGVDRFNPYAKKFQLFQPDMNTVSGLASKQTHAICEDHHKRLWIGTDNGVSVLDRKTGRYINYRHLPGDIHSLADDFIFCIYCDSKGRVWIGTEKGLNRFDEANNSFTLYANHTGFNLPSNNIIAVGEDRKGRLWIGTIDGICTYDEKKNNFQSFKTDSALAELDCRTRSMYFDDNDNLWIGTHYSGGELIRYNTITHRATKWFYHLDDSSSVPGQGILSIMQDKKGFIWLGTNVGLCRYNENTNTFTTYSTKEGLHDGQVAGLLTDDHDNLWMSVANELCMLSPDRKTFTWFDATDGLQENEFRNWSSLKTSDGYFCYAGMNGFNMFHPDSLKVNSNKPRVLIRSLTILDKQINLDSLLSLDSSITLTYNQNFFSFGFTALNFDHPEKNQFACQLIGFDEKMIQLGTEHFVNYTNVPPGKYTLKLLAANNDGIWNEAGISLPLIITPPFWQTWWFYCIAVIAVASVLYSIYRIRINRVVAMERMRSSISRDLHDEIGSSLSSVQIMSAFAEESIDSTPADAKRWVNRIGGNTKEMMEKMRDIVWTLNSSDEISGNIITRMNQYISHTLEPKDIECRLTADEKVNESLNDFARKRNVYLIFKEAVNNAAKYSDCKQVNISLMNESNRLRLTISDNGKGFDTTSSSTGNGLNNMRKRAAEINATIEITSSTGKGTVVSLVMPIPQLRYRFFQKAR